MSASEAARRPQSPMHATSQAQTQREASASEASGAGLLFAALLWLIGHLWLLMLRDLQLPAVALLSHEVQQLVWWSFYLLIDQGLQRRSLRMAWAALATLYCCTLLLDGFLMRMTSMPLREILPMLLASEQVLEGLREIGLTPPRLLLLGGALFLTLLAGAGLRQWLGQGKFCNLRPLARQGLRPAWLLGALLALPLLSASEQTLARDSEDYLYRALRMPGYWQLFEGSSRSVQLSLPAPVAHGQRAQWLQAVGPAKNPRHVLYVLLESFRADLVRPDTCPTIWQLSQQSLSFDNAMAEATYTPLSWSVLLFDEAAHDNLYGRHPRRSEPLGSWLLALMGKAGYDKQVSVSTNLAYARTRERLLGDGRQPLNYFQAAPEAGGNPADKNLYDRQAAEHLAGFIRGHQWQGSRPQFMLLQLDSTHYTYPFPEDQALFKPYSENLALPKALNSELEATLLHNRYRNAAHYVDKQLARVIAALQEAGIYEDTVVVLTSDHGEGMSVGLQGHAAVGDSSKRVPLMLRLPGQAAARSDELIGHRDILPRLVRYLDIAVPPEALRGAKTAAITRPAPAIFTLAASGRTGQLSTPDYVVDLRLIWRPDSVTVTPVQIEMLKPSEESGTLYPSQPPSTADWLPLLRAQLGSPPFETQSGR
ncbi:sulfatase-like hydrolase/transferase [Paucibacter sp. AS339]|uniref:sulfatase-like hydrolase/transferase n=1 Tax=Paucibacter hankyongi TaxID=3133434 RepID=UPI00309C9CC8